MKKFKWILIWCGLKLLKHGLGYRINKEQKKWLRPFPAAELVNRKQLLLDYCRNKSVLHIGFVDAPFTNERINKQLLLHQQLKPITSFLYGIDTNAEAVTMYQQQTGDPNAASVSLEQLDNADALSCDLFLAGEVLEHMPQPDAFIKTCVSLMKTGQELLITVPNYTSLDSIAASLHTTESVHEDHHWYFSPYTLLRKFDRKYWEVKQFAFGVYGDKIPNTVQQQFPATGDCIIAVIKRK
jgi:hypothetical protein